MGDLLEEKALGLALRTGPHAATDRPVRGAAVVEVESPARWIAPEWVLLTAGVRLEGGSDDALRALVADCDEAGVAALAFGVGPVFDQPGCAPRTRPPSAPCCARRSSARVRRSSRSPRAELRRPGTPGSRDAGRSPPSWSR